MAWLTNSETLTNVGRWDKTERTDKSGSTVRKDISVKVWCHDTVVSLWLTEKLVDHGVNDLLLDTDGSELVSCESFTGSRAEETVGLGEDIGLVGDGDHWVLMDALHATVSELLSSESNLSSHGSNAEGGTLRDTLDSLSNLAVLSIVGLLLLDVKVLSVLTDDNHVNQLLIGTDRLDWADVCVEIEAFAKGNDWGGVSFHGLGWGRNSSKESSITLVLENLDGLVWERRTSLLEGLETGIEVGEFELETEGRWEGFEDASTGWNDLLANSITWDKTFELSDIELISMYSFQWLRI